MFPLSDHWNQLRPILGCLSSGLKFWLKHEFAFSTTSFSMTFLSLDALRPVWNGLQEQWVLHWPGIATLWYLLMNINAWCGGTHNRMVLKEETAWGGHISRGSHWLVEHSPSSQTQLCCQVYVTRKTHFLKIAQKQVFFWYDLILFPWLLWVSALQNNVRWAVAPETGIINKNV